MRNIRNSTIVACAAATIICYSVPAGAANNPYTIPVVLPLSGTTAFIGETMERSFRVLEAVVNAEGGVGSRPVHFDIRDDQSSPQTAVQVTEQLLQTNPSAVIGSAIVAQCLAMEPLTRGHAVQYCISPGVHPPYGSDMFSAGFSTGEQSIALMRYAGAKHLTKLATITSTDATGQDADRQIAAGIRANSKDGVRIIDAEHFNPTDASVSAQMQRIKAAQADVLVVWTTGPAFGTVLHAYTDAGMHVPVITTNGNLSFAAMRQFAAYLPDEVLFPTPQFVIGRAPASSPSRASIDRYLKAVHDAGIPNDYQVGVVWDAAMLVVDAVKHVGTTATSKQIDDFILAQRHWVGIMGTYDFADGEGAQRGLLARDVIVSRWDKRSSSWLAVSKPGGQP